jgi:UTP--glucose-1-phosphate uridylyltransferase
MRVKKAIIPATGLGTRFLPATKAQPKEMLPIVDNSYSAVCPERR